VHESIAGDHVGTSGRTEVQSNESEQSVSDPSRRVRSRLLPKRAALGWTGLWLAVAALVVLPYVHSYRHLSPFDEMVHLDYVVKAQHGHMVNGGEKVGQVAMRAQACRGSDLKGFKYPRCNQKVLRPAGFPSAGFNTAYPDPPAYYVVTAAGAAVVGLLPGVNDVVDEARSFGVLWLGAGLALTFLLALRLGANRWAAAGATLIVASNPAVAHAMATVTSDAPALLVGGALCLVTLAVVRRTTSWWWLIPASAACTAVKATGLTVVGLVALFLLFQLAQVARRPVDEDEGEAEVESRDESEPAQPMTRREVWLSLAAVVLPAIAVLGAWTVLTGATAFPSAADIPMRDYFHVDSIGSDELLGNLLLLTTPLQQGYQPPFMMNVAIGVFMAGVNLLALAGVAVLAWTGPRGATRTRLAVATVVAMLVSGTALVVLIYVGSHTYIAIPSRYGLPMVPALAACLAVVASQRRVGGWALVGIGLLTTAALLAQTA